MGAKFQSTLPARGSDVKYVSGRTKKELISIHAPHEGERHGAGRLENGFYNISIHAPHEGERQSRRRFWSDLSTFQSTLPTRGSDKAEGVFGAT